jgi:hypothetical protein
MQANLFSFFLFLFSLSGFSQDSVYILQKKDISKFKKGFLITNDKDTLKGQIYQVSYEKIYFIKDGCKIEKAASGKLSNLPFFLAGDGNIKAFDRDGLYFESHNIFPNNTPVFLNVMDQGPINLYRLIYDYEDAGLDNGGWVIFLVAGGALGGLVYGLANQNSLPDKVHDNAFYVQKGANNPVYFVPDSEKKYREVIYPLVKDNPAFLKSLVGQYFDFQHLVDNISKYNQTAGKK